ncbi:MAG: hypothetical protein M1167_05260, partial [Chloroflexi bacterium]|nr:hypothetical protein [Chloroflexota bacterium]
MKASDQKRNNSSRNKPAKAKSKVGTKICSEMEQGKFLLELYQNALLLSEKELCDYFLNHAVHVTGSKIGFL